MFTGLVQSVGRVSSFDGAILEVEIDPDWVQHDPLAIGESVACNGCCLTQIAVPTGLKFELSPETVARTAFRKLEPGKKINLERAMRPSDRFGGHIVQGHVDTVGEVLSVENRGDHFEFQFQIPVEGDRYLIDNGSIAIDGISLTVVRPEQGKFGVWVIPHTFSHTTFSDCQRGDPVNIEYDVIAKHLEKLARIE
jgi:riboflavin synthase